MVLAFGSAAHAASGATAIVQTPTFPTETETVFATATFNCGGHYTIDDRSVAIGNAAVEVTLALTCTGFGGPVADTHHLVEIGPLAAGNYTLQFSAKLRSDPTLPYGATTRLASSAFKVLPSVRREDLRAFFRTPESVRRSGEVVTVIANDVGTDETLAWETALAGTVDELSLNSEGVGRRPVIQMRTVPLASDPTATEAMLLLSETMRYSVRIDYAGLPLPGAKPSPAYVEIPENGYRMSAARMSPVRLKSNGLEFDAAIVSLRRGDAPWRDYWFALNLGLVGIASRDYDANLSFTPRKLPPPRVTGVVVEYANTDDFPGEPGGHYFYTSDPVEMAQLDAGAMGRFHRTGGSFPIGGYVRTCRFYGSVKPGPNSHFFSADPGECEALKAAQRVPRPVSETQWNYEGFAFEVMPASATAPICTAGLQPVYRLYNNAFSSAGSRGFASNHRYTMNKSAEVDEMIAKGWQNEGVAFCVPSG